MRDTSLFSCLIIVIFQYYHIIELYTVIVYECTLSRICQKDHKANQKKLVLIIRVTSCPIRQVRIHTWQCLFVRLQVRQEMSHRYNGTGETQLCQSPVYRFTKGLTQNLNLRTNLKLEYNIKSFHYIQHNFRFQASFLFC